MARTAIVADLARAGIPATPAPGCAVESVTVEAQGGAFVLTTRGGDFSLHLGEDLAIGYLSHTDTEVRLYLEETLTFLMLTSEAAVGCTPPARRSRSGR